jgi:6-hydroxycyclohex-1-ene-1-carbonyl-CoA dehydrogenase
VEVRLSNLMAFDATAAGNWGCPPDQYPDALAFVLDRRVRLDEYVEFHPLDDASAVFERAVLHTLTRRAILMPPQGGTSVPPIRRP